MKCRLARCRLENASGVLTDGVPSSGHGCEGGKCDLIDDCLRRMPAARYHKLRTSQCLCVCLCAMVRF